MALQSPVFKTTAPGYQGVQLRKDEYHDKYNIGQYTYPESLGFNSDQQHYVTFFINVRGKSRFDTNNRSTIPIKPEGNNIPSANIAVKAALAFNAAIAGYSAAAIEAATSGNLQRAAKDAAGATVAAVVLPAILGLAQTAFPELLEADKTFRLKDVIALHVETPPSYSYGINYSAPDLGTLVGALSGGTSTVDSTRRSVVNSESFAAGALALASIPNVIGGTKLMDLVGAAARVRTNPFTETLFQSVDFRTFSFKYRFLPRSAKETELVYNIIRLFKEHMHPTLSENSLFYIYPSEFEIVYYFRGQENHYLHRISRCALTDLQVDYGSEQFNTFTNGAPAEINLNLKFRELELLDRRRIREGF